MAGLDAGTAPLFDGTGVWFTMDFESNVKLKTFFVSTMQNDLHNSKESAGNADSNKAGTTVYISTKKPQVCFVRWKIWLLDSGDPPSSNMQKMNIFQMLFDIQADAQNLVNLVNLLSSHLVVSRDYIIIDSLSTKRNFRNGT